MMGLAAALATERVSRTMAHQMAEDAARGPARLPQTPPVVEEVPMRATTSVATARQEMSHPAPTIAQSIKQVTRSDVVDPVQQALATATEALNIAKDASRTAAHTAEMLRSGFGPTTGTTWPDLISRWTSRTWLLPFVSGVAAVATLVGTVFGSLDPHITAGSGMIAALFGGLFIILEKKNDGAVRVAQAIQTPAPAAPQAPAHDE